MKIVIVKKRKIFRLFIVSGIFLFIMLMAFDNNIKIRNYKIQMLNLPNELEGLTILQISDLHSTVFPNNQQYLINIIKAQKPDLIFLTGDIADDYIGFEGTELLLTGLEGLFPMYYCIGNHEFWANDFYEINKKIKSYGVVSLEDENTIIDVKGVKILLAGLNDPNVRPLQKNYKPLGKRLDDLYNEVKFDGIKILLSHRPEFVNYYSQYDYDLIFSGHAHGGQVRIPFLINGLWAPNQDYFPKYAGGVYKIKSKNPNDTKLVVSRGLSVKKELPRVFNPPELVVIKLSNPKYGR